MQDADGQGNWVRIAPVSTPDVTIGRVEIDDGAAHVQLARNSADLSLTLATTDTADGGELAIDGKGTYDKQPVAFHAVGGAVLRLRDATSPYPLQFALNSGGTRIEVKGHVQDPLALTGADIRLDLSGPDMAALYPLIGIAVPDTPPYRLSGRLDFADGRIKFSGISGRTGNSDVNGELEVDPHAERPVLTGALTSHQIDMADLAGFIGKTPGRITTPGETPGQKQQVAREEASPNLLPTHEISVPKPRAADVHITYRGEKVIGKNTPFDAIDVKLDIDNGDPFACRPLRPGIGAGRAEQAAIEYDARRRRRC